MKATVPHQGTGLFFLCPTGPWLGKTRGLACGPGQPGQGRAGQKHEMAGQDRGSSCLADHLESSQTLEETWGG